MNIGNELLIDIKHLCGNRWSVKRKDLDTYSRQIRRAAKDVSKLRQSGKGPDGSQVLFPHLPYLLKEEALISREEREALLRLREEAKGYDAVISIGIGGSYLGNQVLFDLFCGPYWNQLTKEERKGYPQIYFSGQNVDPVSLMDLASCIKRDAGRIADRRMKVLLLVISKSGTTIEPVTAVRGLQKLLDPVCDIHLMAITDKEKGRIRPLAEKEHFPCFTVPDGIGGRFSELSQVGLVFARLIGVDIKDLLSGARMVEEACRSEKAEENPALFLASLKYAASRKYGIAAEIIMPYGDTLRSFGWWYAQLLGESLGKKYDMAGHVIHYGRIPVAAVGTTDMHSLTQEHQQGAKNKLVQFISVKESRSCLSVPCEESGETGDVPMDFMLESARKANEQALAAEGRMSCAIKIRKITPFHLGALMYFFFLTIAYEGALADINAFDQPGVEDYKKILHQDIRDYIVRNK
jgi:glucose-6-phosphate isomerase